MTQKWQSRKPPNETWEWVYSNRNKIEHGQARSEAEADAELQKRITAKKKEKCKFCQYKRDFSPLVETDDGSSGVKVYITDGQLIASGWFDTFVGIKSEERKINFCPMCGRNLAE